MNLNLRDNEMIPTIEIIFSDFMKLNKKSKNFNISEKVNNTLFDIKYDDDKLTKKELEFPVTYQKSPIIDGLSSSFLDKIFTDSDMIVFFQRNINIYFNALVARYILYINEEKKEINKLNETDILFIWKGSTAMKTIYKKYSEVLDKSVDETYGKYFSKKSDADCAIFINPNNKDADFHRNNMIILSFLMLNWLRNNIMKDAINNIMKTISFDINYNDIRLAETKEEKTWDENKNIKTQKWSFENISRFDRIVIPKKNNYETTYIKYYLHNENYTNDAGNDIDYYENKQNDFFLSIHDKTLTDKEKCNNFNKNFSLIKLKYDIICKLDVVFIDNTTRTLYYILSNDIIDMAIRTIDDDSLKLDYNDITAITQVYQKISFAPNKKFNFRSYTLDGFIMDFMYNLFKTPSDYGGCNPMYVAKYQSNLNRFFYFILLKLLYINIDDSEYKKGTIINNLLIENIKTIRYRDITTIKKTGIMVFDYLINCVVELQKIYSESYYTKTKENSNLKLEFTENILDQLKFIDTILRKPKSEAIMKVKPTSILYLNKYLKYKNKYFELKKLINN